METRLFLVNGGKPVGNVELVRFPTQVGFQGPEKCGDHQQLMMRCCFKYVEPGWTVWILPRVFRACMGGVIEQGDIDPLERPILLAEGLYQELFQAVSSPQRFL